MRAKWLVLFAVTAMLLAPSLAFAGSDISRMNFKGSTVPAQVLTSSGQMKMTDGITSEHVLWTNPTVSTRAVFDLFITTDILTRQGTTYTQSNFITQPVYPQVLTVAIWVGTNAATSNTIQTGTETVKSTITVVGVTAQGEVVSEPVQASTTPVKTLRAFATISSITVGAFQTVRSTDTNYTAYIVVGTTGTFGLPFNVEETRDIYKVKAFGVDSTSYTINTAWDTLKINDNSNGIVTIIEAWGRRIYSAPPRSH